MSVPVSHANQITAKKGNWSVGRSAIHLALIFLVYWATACLCLNSYMERWGFRAGGGLDRMMTYTAPRPFAYRVLVPVIVNNITAAIPTQFKASLYDYFDQSSEVRKRYFGGNNTDTWDADYSLKYHLTYFIDFLSLFGLILLLRQLCLVCYPGCRQLADFAPLPFAILLPLIFLRGGYFYDFPELLLLAGSFHAALRKRIWQLAFLVPLAVLNKEPDVLLPILLAPILFSSLPRMRALIVTVVLLMVGGAVFLFLRVSFAGNAGSGVEYHLPENLRYWASLRSFLGFTSILAPAIPFPKIQNVLFAIPLAALLFWRWREKPVYVKQLFCLALVVNAPLLLFFGNADEIRNLSLTFISAYLAYCHSMLSMYGSNCDAAPVAGWELGVDVEPSSRST
jgi:hypothetical protein